jgi:hypothetical protein
MAELMGSLKALNLIANRWDLLAMDGRRSKKDTAKLRPPRKTPQVTKKPRKARGAGGIGRLGGFRVRPPTSDGSGKQNHYNTWLKQERVIPKFHFLFQN